SYALGFAVIGLQWVRHHAFYRGVDEIDTMLTVVNLIYLGLVAFMPYPTRILGLYGSQPAAIVLYATTVTLVSIVARVMVVHAIRAGLLSDAGRRETRRRQNWWIVPAVFLISIPISFWSASAALYSWGLLFVLPRIHRIATRH
ncbi:MAG TPA: TMEM175 family protein, partial [Acidimicrobiales bacterium]